MAHYAGDRDDGAALFGEHAGEEGLDGVEMSDRVDAVGARLSLASPHTESPCILLIYFFSSDIQDRMWIDYSSVVDQYCRCAKL